MSEPPPPPARYIMIGGFLGAGKSTAVVALAEHLKSRGKRVGLITNDQSVGLVDTALMSARGFDVAEIAGGCFCCRFDSLVQAADRLSEEHAPDVFVAEPVGSCTDLVATVSYPLRRMYGQKYRIAPLSVMVDPLRAERVLGLATGKSFSPKVIYVYRKQLEEADLIVINKRDLLDEHRLRRLREALGAEFPRAEVLAVSARSGDGLADWFDRITKREAAAGPTMPIDYDQYAEGEALLGWLNATLTLSAPQPVDGERLMMDLTESIAAELRRNEGDIAHLKMTLVPTGSMAADGPFRGGQPTAVLNLVGGELVPELSQSLPEKVRGGELIVNLRAEAEPERLRHALDTAVGLQAGASGTMSLTLTHAEQFRPARPEPTWRLADAEGPITGEPAARRTGQQESPS